MAIAITFISNCDDAVVFWKIPKRIPGCWGFAIEKERRLPGGGVVRVTLDNRMGFEGDAPKVGEHRPSTEWPFQRFWWADYTANLGDTVRYRVTPMAHAGGKLTELIDERSKWTAWATLSGGKQDGFSSFFNRGLVISQFMARYLENLRVEEGLATRKEALSVFKASLGNHELPIRKFLSGALRTTLLDLLAKARKDKQHVYGALYELEDEELIGALGALGRKAHVVLANGSIQAKKGEGVAAARKRDQNKAGRKALRDANAEVFDRFISPGALGHNKFLVFADAKASGITPSAVWTGSTNWTGTGLCTQINNGLLVRDPEAAAQYLAQWERLRDAGSAFPPELVADNSLPATFKHGKTSADIWFSRTKGKVDLKAIDEVLHNAKEGVLFLMFQPGGTGTLATVRKLQETKKSLYIKGVVSTLPPQAQGDEEEVSVSVVNSQEKSSVKLDVVQPVGVNKFANWAATVARNEFITMSGGVIGFAIVHSKLIVVDPFTNPVVITGSHNFSGSASEKNDENFMIVRGNEELALQYSAHILAVYHHYRYLAYVKDKQSKGGQPRGFLRETDEWQDGQLKGPARRELDFWVR